MGDILKIGEYIEINGTRVNCITDIGIKFEAGDFARVTITFDAESVEFETFPELFGPSLFMFKKETRVKKIRKKIKKGIGVFLTLKTPLWPLIWKIRMYFRKRLLRRAEEQCRQDSDTS